MAAVFIEESEVLEELFDSIGEEVIKNIDSDPEAKEHLLSEISDVFFRLDLGRGAELRGECIEVLRDLWEVHDRNSVLKTLEDIRTQGHRVKFNVLKSCIADSDRISANSMEKFKQIFSFDFPNEADLSLNDEQYRQLATWIQKTDRFIGSCGILAWDSARLVHLARLSYMAGYLNDNEAWAEILKMAPLCIGKFKDWREFALSFIIGRTFWVGEEDPLIKKGCERLLGNPVSPWQFFDTK